MLVQTHFPQKLSSKRYDQYLASGWFRGSVMLYKMDLLCLENDLYSVINIRLNLEKHALTKSLKKINRRASQKFRIEISNARITTEKEELYQLQKRKFQGFIHNTLHDFLYSGFRNTVFSTQEVSVYDGDKLVACSFFDLGERSLASLLGIYNPEYSSFSLGIFTMLMEVEYGKKNGYKWYYPGYILNEDKGFDYKLRLGNYQYYNENQRWSNFDQFNPDKSLSCFINSHLQKLQTALDHKGIPFRKWLYPYFGIGYMNMWEIDFLKLPIILEVQRDNSNRVLFVSFSLDEKEFQAFWGIHAKNHEHLVNMAISDKMKNNANFLLKLFEHIEYVAQTSDLVEFIDVVKSEMCLK